MITLELTNDEAESFKKFRQYQDQFETLLKSGVFHIKSGQAIVDFNKDCVIMTVHVNTIGFKRVKKQ